MGHYDVEPKVECEKCRYFRIDGIRNRCMFETNIKQNWLGAVYIKQPSHRNYKGDCVDYEDK